ncbi:MAG: type II toxin-antitoxin system VapC family toxin [Gammaproteobacteria bacterium]
MRDHVYLDSSALVKLVVLEPESAALREFLRSHTLRMASALAEVEVPRALWRAGFGAAERRRATEVLARIPLVEVDRRILRDAAALAPASLRSLDAIHLATALSLGQDLAGMVTYDQRLSEAAAGAEVAVWAPA